MDMRELKFGMEIEAIGQTRSTVANALKRMFGDRAARTSVDRANGYAVYPNADGSETPWRVIFDGSLSHRDESAEVVSPPLCYADLGLLQRVVRTVREAGCYVDNSCGVHVHVDASAFTPKTLLNLTNLVCAYEEHLFHALDVSEHRRNRYTRPVNRHFVNALREGKPTTMTGVGACWYEVDEDEVEGEGRSHYHSTRYRGLNLHAIWQHGTVEFRYFNGTLHTGKVKAYTQLALAMSAYALNTRTVKGEDKPYGDSAKYDFRVLMNRMGMIGPEFEAARKHLLGGLPGPADVKNR